MDLKSEEKRRKKLHSQKLCFGKCGGKIQTNNSFDDGAHFYHYPPCGIGLTSISNLKIGPYTQFRIMGGLHLTYVSILHDMIRPLEFESKDIVCGGEGVKIKI